MAIPVKEPEELLEEFFTYHPVKEGQAEKYNEIREAGKRLALCIFNNTPSCSDQSAAIRKVREACMTANAAIAINT